MKGDIPEDISFILFHSTAQIQLEFRSAHSVAVRFVANNETVVKTKMTENGAHMRPAVQHLPDNFHPKLFFFYSVREELM